MPRRSRSVPRQTPSVPMALEVIERHVFTVSNPELAANLRQALAADDIERLDDLISFLQEFHEADLTTNVLKVGETPAPPQKGR